MRYERLSGRGLMPLILGFGLKFLGGFLVVSGGYRLPLSCGVAALCGTYQQNPGRALLLLRGRFIIATGARGRGHVRLQ